MTRNPELHELFSEWLSAREQRRGRGSSARPGSSRRRMRALPSFCQCHRHAQRHRCRRGGDAAPASRCRRRARAHAARRTVRGGGRRTHARGRVRGHRLELARKRPSDRLRRPAADVRGGCPGWRALGHRDVNPEPEAVRRARQRVSHHLPIPARHPRKLARPRRSSFRLRRIRRLPRRLRPPGRPPHPAQRRRLRQGRQSPRRRRRQSRLPPRRWRPPPHRRPHAQTGLTTTGT